MKVELQATEEKLIVSRDDIQEIRDMSAPFSNGTGSITVPKSFDEAGDIAANSGLLIDPYSKPSFGRRPFAGNFGHFEDQRETKADDIDPWA